MTPERIAELRSKVSDARCEDDAWPDSLPASVVAECLDEIERLRDSEQSWIDRAAYYRNLAVEAGVPSDRFDNEYDQRIAKNWEQLHAEVTRLRAALKPFAEMTYQHDLLYFLDEIDAARAAMEDKHDEL